MTITISKSDNHIKCYVIFGQDTKTGRMHTRYCKFKTDYKSVPWHSRELNTRIERITKELFDRWSEQFWTAVAYLNNDHLGDATWNRSDTRFLSGGDELLYKGRNGYCKIFQTITYEAEIVRKDPSK